MGFCLFASDEIMPSKAHNFGDEQQLPNGFNLVKAQNHKTQIALKIDFIV